MCKQYAVNKSIYCEQGIPLSLPLSEIFLRLVIFILATKNNNNNKKNPTPKQNQKTPQK